jgi:hypothetical protein
MNRNIINQIFPNEAKLLDQNKCPFCKEEINFKDFRNHISIKEHQISGLCQVCQDKTFGKD